MTLPKHYYRDYNRRKKEKDPEWYAKTNLRRAELRRNNKTKAVALFGGLCAHCKQSFPDCCFDFHHIDPTEVNDVPSTILHCSWERIEKELKKCIMLCACCHRIEHNKDGYIAHEKRKL